MYDIQDQEISGTRLPGPSLSLSATFIFQFYHRQKSKTTKCTKLRYFFQSIIQTVPEVVSKIIFKRFGFINVFIIFSVASLDPCKEGHINPYLPFANIIVDFSGFFWSFSLNLTKNCYCQREPPGVIYKRSCFNSKENTCIEVSFLIKLLYYKRDSGTSVFLYNLRKSLRTHFLQNTPDDCFSIAVVFKNVQRS